MKGLRELHRNEGTAYNPLASRQDVLLPPHAVVLEGIDIRKKEFAVAITAVYLLPSRRSFEDWKLEAAEVMKEVESDPNLSNAY